MRVLLPKDAETVSMVVTRHFSLSLADLKSKSREEHLVRARQIIWHILYHRGASYAAIASRFEKDTGTVRKGCGMLLNLMGTDAALLFTVKTIESRCKLLLEAN